MNMKIRRVKFLISILGALIFVMAFMHPVEAQETVQETAQRSVRLLLTSNIQGRASLDISNQETEDPLLVLGQNIVAQRARGVDFYLDLGNGFYPGVLSKFSTGSIMMDFFDYFSCAATLVASKDLHIGLENLEFLKKNKSTQLLSANLTRQGTPIFTPYFVRVISGVPVAFIGLSSKKVEIDVAEEELYDISQENEKQVLVPLIEELGAKGVERIVLLSGMKLSRTMRLMHSFEQIDLALCGGDYVGSFYSGKISRIDLSDGRSAIMLDNAADYFLLDLDLTQGVSVRSIQPKKAVATACDQSNYFAFRNRLTLWKKKYITEQSRQIAETDNREYLLDDQRLLQLLRDRFDSEIAIVETNTINPYPIRKDIDQSDLLHLVNMDYKIFTFQLTGAQLEKLMSQKDNDLETAGMVQGKKVQVQGYAVESQRRYSVAATQSAYRKIKRILKKDIEFKNSWKSVTDLLIADLEKDKISLRDDYTYLEKRYRKLVDVYLSNYISSATVERDPNIKTPVAQPSDDYSKWGLEDKIDLILYNNKHRFVLTPYVLYARQDDDYIQNLLRGTFLYEYNLRETIKPYNKFQYDTVVEPVDGMAPILIRETMGGSLYGKYLTGKIGIGLEKKVRDPEEDALYGFETILNFEYSFWTYFTYIFNIDNFISTRDVDNGKWGIRSEVDNILAVNLNDHLSLSFKYKHFYLYEDDLDEDYRSTQFFTTVDLMTDWKFW